MAVYKRFEDLPVWQEAARLYNSVLDLLQTEKLTLGSGWRFQFERAALSVSNNIAEGFERFTPGELRNFLVIARGSAGEVRSMAVLVAKRREAQLYISRLKEIQNVAESCARQLGGWIQTFDGPKSGPSKLADDKRQTQNAKPPAARPHTSHDQQTRRVS
jgi:four helix bundle protein